MSLALLSTIKTSSNLILITIGKTYLISIL